jgi:hypothetical protein
MKTDAEHAKAARDYAAAYLEEALWNEEHGRPVAALQAFEDALNAERWAVYYETQDANRRKVLEVTR